MCSVGDDIYDNEADKLMPTTIKSRISYICNKCRMENPCIVLRTKDVYCRNCFLVGTVHKFKASLGKSRLIRPNDRVLVWHQIGHPSTALLHFLRSGLDLNTPKRLRFEPVILFIDDQYHLTSNERYELLEKAKLEANYFGFQLNLISFADYVVHPNNVSEFLSTKDISVSESDKDKIEKIIKKKTTKTKNDDIQILIRRQLLVDVAKYYKCKFVFTSEISVDIAANILSNVSLGRGPHISIDTGFCDNRDSEIKILRPLRLFDMKELAFYNKFNNLEPLSIRQKEVEVYSSVHNLMRKFVKELQVNYPATVMTILKTGDKLGLDKSAKQMCSLCKGPLPVLDDQLTSQQSTTFSHLVSTQMPDYSISGRERYQKMSDHFDQMKDNSIVCYACSNICDSLIKT